MLKEHRKLMLFCYFVMLTVAVGAATQYVASKLDYQEALYGSIYSGDDYKFYFPYMFFFWWNDYNTEARELFRQGWNVITFCVMGMFLLGFWLVSKLGSKLSDNHGSAKWASYEYISKTFLFNGKGVFLGITSPRPGLWGKLQDKLNGYKYLRDDEPTHILLVAPTRSGKGVGVIIPSLLYWEGSTVVLDIKGENFDETAGWRKKKMGNIVLRYKPSSTDNCVAFNPFDEIRKGTPTEILDVMNIVDFIVNPSGKPPGGSEAHWITSAESLMTGIVLHLLYTKDNPNISDVLDFLACTNVPMKVEEDIDNDGNIIEIKKPVELREHLADLVVAMKDKQLLHDETGEVLRNVFGGTREQDLRYVHPLVLQIFSKMSTTPEQEFGSIKSTLDTVLNTFRDPVLAKNMSHSDFRIADLMNNEKPVSLYIVLSPSDLKRLMPVAKILIELIFRRNCERELKDYKHRLLFVLDEFPAIGKMEAFEEALGYIAGYGMKAMVIVQDLTQLYKQYTKDNSIVANCHTQIYFTPNEMSTAKLLSETLDKATIRTRSESYNTGITFGASSVNYNETGRSLMTPGELRTMPDDTGLILISTKLPIKAKKIRWYADDNFHKRRLTTPLTDRIECSVADDWKADMLAKIRDNAPEAAAPAMACSGSGMATKEAIAGSLALAEDAYTDDFPVLEQDEQELSEEAEEGCTNDLDDKILEF